MQGLPSPRGRSSYYLRVRDGRYAIVDADGVRHGVWFRSRDQALVWRDELQRKADLKARRGPRSCLCCGATFNSEGIHNRLCPACRRCDPGEPPQRPQIERQPT